MAQRLLQVRDLSVRFRNGITPALSRIEFEINEGESIAVLGESGAGKTTLARALLRLVPVSVASIQGQAYFRGTELLTAKQRVLRRIRGAEIVLISQDPELALNPVMRVRDQIEEVVRAHVRATRKARRSKALAALEATGLSERLSTAYPHELSGGQRQRVVIAQALVLQPALLILDEPTSALDNVVQAEILALIASLAKDFRLALIYITHDPALARMLAKRALVLHHGCLVESGPLEDVLYSPKHTYTAKLIHSIPSFPTGRDMRQHASIESRGGISIEAREVCKVYRQGTRALDHATLQIPGCSTLALVGKSGSGKSTLARCFALLEAPDSGEIRIAGKPVRDFSIKELKHFRSKIQLIWQHSALAMNPRFQAVDVIAEPLRIRKLTGKIDARKRAVETMEKFGLPANLALRSPLELSGGQRQRLAIARAVIAEPSVLILDEAFAGLDLPLQGEIATLLLSLKQSLPVSYLLITHDLLRAASFAQQIAVMQDGKIVEQADPGTLFSQPEHPASRELVSAVPVLKGDSARTRSHQD